MRGFFKIDECGETCTVRDETTRGTIEKRVVKMHDWLKGRASPFAATLFGTLAQTGIGKGDIIYGELLLKVQGEATFATLLYVVKIGHEESSPQITQI